MSNPVAGSERARLDPFVALADDGISMRNQRDLMSQPFFSLAKGRRNAPILYEAGGIRVEVHGLPEHGMATIWDADVLIWPPAKSSRPPIKASSLPASSDLRPTSSCSRSAAVRAKANTCD